MQLAFALILLASIALAQEDNCTTKHCKNELKAVIAEGGEDILRCLGACKAENPRCGYDCGYFNTTIPIHKLFQCEADNHCYKPESKVIIGTCIGTDDETVDAVSMNFLSGDWWNVKGA